MEWSIAGFGGIKKYFENAIAHGDLTHAYLFSGPSMIGKFSFAKDLAKHLNGRLPDQDPDARIVACRIEEETSAISIEDVRSVKSFLVLKPLSGTRRVVIIDGAEFLTQEASNALLKMLEEPPPHGIFFLVSSQPGLLPRTVVSRCQEFRFPVHADDLVREHVRPLASSRDVETIIRLARGRLGWAIVMAKSGGAEKVREAVVQLGTIARSGAYERMRTAQELIERKLYRELITFWHIGLHALIMDPLHITSPLRGFPRLLRSLSLLNRRTSQSQFNHRLALEHFLLTIPKEFADFAIKM